MPDMHTYKFNTKDCNATQCGAKNPTVVALATTILQEANQFVAAKVIGDSLPLQNVASALKDNGIQLG